MLTGGMPLQRAHNGLPLHLSCRILRQLETSPCSLALPPAGGGWGDPLERPYDEVERDLSWGKVSFDGARDGYGVVAAGTKESVVIDAAASDALRESLRSQRSGQEPFFDRARATPSCPGGATSASVDWL